MYPPTFTGLIRRRGDPFADAVIADANNDISRAIAGSMEPVYKSVRASVHNRELRVRYFKQWGTHYTVPIFSGTEKRPWMQTRSLYEGIRLVDASGNNITESYFKRTPIAKRPGKIEANVISDMSHRYKPNVPYGGYLNEGFRHWQPRGGWVQYKWWTPAIAKHPITTIQRRFERNMANSYQHPQTFTK